MIIYGLVFCKGFVLQDQALKKTSFNDSANFIQKSRDVFPLRKFMSVSVCLIFKLSLRKFKRGFFEEILLEYSL